MFFEIICQKVVSRSLAPNLKHKIKLHRATRATAICKMLRL